MQSLYTDEEFQNAKSRQPLPLKCLYCTQIFNRTKHEIQISQRPIRGNPYNFCSNKCQRDFESPPIIVSCKQCYKTFRKSPSAIKKTKHHFCCKSCAAKWHNAHKTKGTRVSKLEVWLSKQLPTLYPSLEFHFNRKDAINSELDIYIPKLKLAFELNGIFHYEPIYGPDKLLSIQTNDHRKILTCVKRGIELCIIDVSSITYFKEQRIVRFLTIITTIIELKLSGSSPVSSETA